LSVINITSLVFIFFISDTPACRIGVQEERRIISPSASTAGTPDGESVVEHIAGIEDYQLALVTFRAACQRWPGTPITLRQGARVIEDRPASARGLTKTSSGPGRWHFQKPPRHFTHVGTVVVLEVGNFCGQVR
jgi:hypothetical protein